MVLIAGLKFAQPLCVPVLLAFFIATVSFPITSWLRRHRVPNPLAVLLTVVVDFLFLAAVVVLVISMVGDVQSKWESKYKDLTVTRIDEASVAVAGTLDQWGVENARERVDSYFRNQSVEQLNQIDFGKILSVSTNVVGRVASFVGTAVLVMILVVFMLSEAAMFGRRFHAISAARGPNFERMLSATRDIQRFLGIKTAVSLGTGVLAGFLCWSAGMDFFILWGILAYALNYVPVVGSIIAGIPPTVLALLTAGVPSALVVAGGFLLINMFLGNFLEPTLMGRRFGLPTLVVVVSVLFWGFIWGPIGMLLAVPLTMMVKVVLDNSASFRWLSIAISKEEPSRIALATIVAGADPGEMLDEARPRAPGDPAGSSNP
jgi:AI-2 transport protein TqsA